MNVPSSAASILIAIGCVFLFGLAADFLGRKTMFPRVTVMLIAGLIIGPSGMNVMPASVIELFPILTAVSLTMVGFLLGQKLTEIRLHDDGKIVFSISLSVVVVTGIAVSTGLFVLGAPIELALILGGVATATAPAATVDVVRQSNATGTFSKTLLGVVAIDDAWGLLIFSVLLSAAESLSGSGGAQSALASGAIDSLLAILVGCLVGLPVSFLTGRLRPGEPTQIEALGSVFLAAGLAIWLDVSYVLSAIALGITVAKLAKHHARPFHAIEGFQSPFLLLFFILAGASLDIRALQSVGMIGVFYVVLRCFGRVAGAQLGSIVSHAPRFFRRWLGLALLPQAGIPVGLALLASQRLPDLAGQILPVVIGSTVFFELVGPMLTKLALEKADSIEQ
jgi:Kef-type K+ transport system membrane component KefB